MKTNYELLKEVFEEINKENGCHSLSVNSVDDYLSIRYEDEEAVRVYEESLEESEYPIKQIIIGCFYEFNERAKSKEKVKDLERELNRNFRNILKLNNDEEILSLVENSKEIKAEINSLKDDLKWTKTVARNLYRAEELFREKIGSEVM